MFSSRAALAAATSLIACSTISVSHSASLPVRGPAELPAHRYDIDSAARAAAIAPDDAEVEYRWGAALLAGGRAAEALGPLSFAVELSPRDVAFRRALASVLAETGDTVGAVKTLRDVPQLSPSPADAERAVRLARALTDPFRGLPAEQRSALAPCLTSLDSGDPGEALDEADGVIARFRRLAPAHLIAALAADRLGDAPRAMAELQQAAVLGPSLPQPHSYLAELLLREHPEEAAAEYDAALERNPLDVEALTKLGSLQLDRLSRPIQAADTLARAAALRPNDVALHGLAVRAELTAGLHAAARRRVSAVIAGHRGESEALLRLAYGLYEQRSRAPPAERELLTQCIQQVLDAAAMADPDNRSAQGLRRVLTGG